MHCSYQPLQIILPPTSFPPLPLLHQMDNYQMPTARSFIPSSGAHQQQHPLDSPFSLYIFSLERRPNPTIDDVLPTQFTRVHLLLHFHPIYSIPSESSLPLAVCALSETQRIIDFKFLHVLHHHHRRHCQLSSWAQSLLVFVETRQQCCTLYPLPSNQCPSSGWWCHAVIANSSR